MNANFLYILLAFVGVLCNARPQQTSNLNIPLESEVDYQDYYQPTPKQTKPVLLARPAKARSPIIPSISATQNKVTPVPILKQINRHNEDGSYTYGFEGADGSFKIETKLASGEVIGKYGYVDDSGKTRVVEYGANKYGFQPAGEGITVPPATITNDTDKVSDDSDAYQEEPSTPKISVKMPNPKRKPLRPSQGIHHRQQLRPKPSAYLVQELDENSVPSRPESNQRQLITPGDINSLQYLLGGDLQEVVAAQYPSNEIAQRKSNSAVKLQEEDAQGTSNRPFVQSFPIPAIFEMNSAQTVANNDFAQSKFVPQYELPDGTIRGAISKSQTRNKSRPQYLLISPVDDAQLAQSIQSSVPVRRHSSRQENRSILDELLKQYSIPNMAAPINNFSFGYMST